MVFILTESNGTFDVQFVRQILYLISYNICFVIELVECCQQANLMLRAVVHMYCRSVRCRYVTICTSNMMNKYQKLPEQGNIIDFPPNTRPIPSHQSCSFLILARWNCTTLQEVIRDHTKMMSWVKHGIWRSGHTYRNN